MLLFFRIILSIIAIITAIVFTIYIILKKSVIRLKINNLIYSSSCKKNKLQFDGSIGLYFWGTFKILSIKLDNSNNKSKVDKLMKNKYIKDRVNKIKSSAKSLKKLELDENNKLIIKQIKESIIIDNLEFKSYIDTESVILTSYIIGIISILVLNLLRENLNSKPKFQILPLYKNQNYFYIQLNSIISIKVVHIINMFKLIGGMKNERKSNRRLNVNCYGKY